MVATLEVECDTVILDRDLTGFGVRANPSGGRVYVAQARGPKKKNGPQRVLARHFPGTRKNSSPAAAKIGCTSETLRKWVRQAERDSGPAIGADEPRA